MSLRTSETSSSELVDLLVQNRGTKMDAQLADYIIGESGCETSHSPHVAITEHVTLGWYS